MQKADNHGSLHQGEWVLAGEQPREAPTVRGHSRTQELRGRRWGVGGEAAGGQSWVHRNNVAFVLWEKIRGFEQECVCARVSVCERVCLMRSESCVL